MGKQKPGRAGQPIPFSHTKPSARDELITSHLYLAESIAAGIHRRLPPYIQLDDCISEAYIGLVQAADRYQASTHVPFSAFARRRIGGAVIDSIRRKNYKHTKTLQLCEFPDQVRSCQIDTIRQVESELDQAKRRNQVVRSIDSLSDPLHRRMLALRYFKSCQACDREEHDCATCPRAGMTGKAAGKVIGIGESTSSQVHKQAVASLRRSLRGAPHFAELQKAA